MKDVKVLYISDINPDTLVFHSQVVGMVLAWNQITEATLLYHSRKRHPFSGNGFTAVESKGWPSIIRLIWRLETLRNNWRKLLAGYEVIHCRGAVTAWMALKAIPRKKRKYYKIIYDCRGAFVEELNYRPQNLIYAMLNLIRGSEYRAMERWVMARADVVLAVSEQLSCYLGEHYGRKADLIIPAIIDTEWFRFSSLQRQEIRRQLGWGNETVFIYVGSAAEWQRLDILGQWWPLYFRKNPRDRLLALTDSPAKFLKATGMIEGAAQYNITIASVPHSEIPGYLSAADYGIIFRDESLVNQVSSPVKLSEYLASGLLIITNQKYFQERNTDSIFLAASHGNDIFTDIPYRENQRLLRSEYWCEQLSAKNAVNKINKIDRRSRCNI